MKSDSEREKKQMKSTKEKKFLTQELKNKRLNEVLGKVLKNEDVKQRNT